MTDHPRTAQSPSWNGVLKALREARGVTQDGWATWLGVSRATIQRWESGEAVPGAAAEGTIVAVLRERGLLRSYTHGPLGGLDVTQALIADLLAEARAGTARGGSPSPAPTREAAGERPPPAPALAGSAPATSFIGREAETRTVERLLESSRLLTLTGTGGVGKTRLALHVADAVADRYPDGVRLVELAAILDPALLPQAVARALDVREQPGRQPLESVADALRDKGTLLLLDNCEHLREAAAAMAEALLRACRGLRILATSREPLDVVGETVWWVPSLAVPSSEFRVPSSGGSDSELATRNSELAKAGPQRLTANGVIRAESAQLFCARATAAHPAFALTDANAPAVAAICRRLDGIPLAIELAAARARVLTPEQIAARLDARLRLLTRGNEDALPRQQTLRAALDWSYDLLTAPQRTLLARLSVFPGGCDLETAETVCADDREQGGGSREQSPPHQSVSSDALVDLLHDLVEKSLVTVEYREETARYRLLETVRQYAQERLADAAETEDLQRRLAAWALTLAGHASPRLVGSEQVIWLPRLEIEHDNLRAVLLSALDTGDTILGLRLAGAMWRFWQARGHLSEGRSWLERLLARDEAAPPSVRATALLGAGALAFEQGDLASAGAYMERSVALAQDAGDGTEAEGVLMLGALAWRRSDYTAAHSHCEESLAIARVAGDQRLIARCQNLLGLIALDQGRYPDAQLRFEEALALARTLGDLRTSAVLLSNLGLIAHRIDAYERARGYLEQALALNRRLNNPTEVSRNLTTLALVARALDDTDAALLAAQEALALARTIQNLNSMAEALNQLTGITRSRGDLSVARAYSIEHLQIAQQVQSPVHVLAAVTEASGNARAGGDVERAVRLLAASEAYRESIELAQHEGMRRVVEEQASALRDLLGDAAFAAAWGEGTALSGEQAVAYALASEDGPRFVPGDPETVGGAG